MAICYICGEEITRDNKSIEHIILNSIGGKLKSSELLCKYCNSRFGTEIDAELSKQFNHLANMLDIGRENGTPQLILGKNKRTGEPLFMAPGGKPVKYKPEISIQNDGEKTTITAIARSKEEAKAILKDLQKKYPKIYTDGALNSMQIKREYSNDIFEYKFTLGGPQTFRSICKTAINYYIYCKGNREYIQHLIPYVRDGTDCSCVWYLYTNEEIIQKESEQIIHGIVLRGDSQNKLLFAYIEFFNAYRFVVLLNDKYNGIEMNNSYLFDVVKRAECKLLISNNITKETIIQVLNKKANPRESLVYHLDALFPIILAKQKRDLFDELTARAYKNSFGKYPEGTLITPEMIKELTEEFMKEITPWLVNKFKDDFE